MSDAFFNYMPFYRYVASIDRYSRYVEVGVYTGASCAFLARQLLDRGAKFELYAVDLWDQVNAETDYERQVGTPIWNEFVDRLRRENLMDVVRILKKESAAAASHFEDGTVDFVFIDANHSYEHVKADIQAWLPKMKQGGLLSGHDYGEPCGVKQAVDELLGDKVSLMGTCWYTFIR
jgi:predicted O-methyltransferase YrrM